MAVEKDMFDIVVNGQRRGVVHRIELGNVVQSYADKTYATHIILEKKQQTPDEDFPYEFICHECAYAKGGEWPDGHVATFHANYCPYCNKWASLCNIGDFDWPDNKRRGMRD